MPTESGIVIIAILESNLKSHILNLKFYPTVATNKASS